MTDPIDLAIARMQADAKAWRRRQRAQDERIDPEPYRPIGKMYESRTRQSCDHCGKARRPEDLKSVAGCSVCKDDPVCRNRALGWRAMKYRDTA